MKEVVDAIHTLALVIAIGNLAIVLALCFRRKE